jgi:hypothetical protein
MVYAWDYLKISNVKGYLGGYLGGYIMRYSTGCLWGYLIIIYKVI